MNNRHSPAVKIKNLDVVTHCRVSRRSGAASSPFGLAMWQGPPWRLTVVAAASPGRRTGRARGARQDGAERTSGRKVCRRPRSVVGHLTVGVDCWPAKTAGLPCVVCSANRRVLAEGQGADGERIRRKCSSSCTWDATPCKSTFNNTLCLTFSPTQV